MMQSAQWTVPHHHPAFAGHFPGTPIVPGVLLLDAVLHCIAAATGIAMDTCEISLVKFLSPAGPGDELVIQHALSAHGSISFDVLAGTRKIVTGLIVPRVPSVPR